jgi:hypothetical protein
MILQNLVVNTNMLRNIMPLSSRFRSFIHSCIFTCFPWKLARIQRWNTPPGNQFSVWQITITAICVLTNSNFFASALLEFKPNKHTSIWISSLSNSTSVDHKALNAALLRSAQEKTGCIISPAAFRQHLVEQPIEWSSTHCDSLPLHYVHYCLDLPTDTILPFRHARCAGVCTTHLPHLLMPFTVCFLRWYWMFNIMKLTGELKAIY